MSKIRTMVVDDEPVARERIVGLLSQEKDIELVGECADGLQAVAAIQNQNPDLVFLDVQMPVYDGFKVIEEIGADRVWDNWRIEGPSFVWYFRGEPHVHVWVHIADDPSPKLNS